MPMFSKSRSTTRFIVIVVIILIFINVYGCCQCYYCYLFFPNAFFELMLLKLDLIILEKLF